MARELLRRFVCLLLGHQWNWSRAIAGPGSQNPMCSRCSKYRRGKQIKPVRPVYRVRSAESRNSGADIPGASRDMERLAALIPKRK